MTNHLINAISAAVSAGNEILKIYNQNFSVEYKDDKSPLTEADLVANQIIVDILGIEFPILSEESSQIPFAERKNWKQFWMVDPLDGTKEFIKKNGEFTVNIAFIYDSVPVMGVVYVPVTKQLFWGMENEGSFQLLIENPHYFSVEEIISKGKKMNNNQFPKIFTIVASRSHLSIETAELIEEYRQKHQKIQLINSGSSLKICLVAGRKAHVYPRLAPTMEWDTAAAHAVAKFAGCKVYDYVSFKELVYNKENLLNPWFVVELS